MRYVGQNNFKGEEENNPRNKPQEMFEKGLSKEKFVIQ